MARWRAIALTRRQKIVAAVVVVVLAGSGGIAYAASDNGATTNPNNVVIFSRVQARTLQDTVALTGTLARKQIRNVDASTEGLVSAVYDQDGDTTTAGQAMFAINGRDAVAEPGTLPFFRSLVPGDQGADVLELKQILAAAGDYPGAMTDLYTEQTQFALAQWQAQHDYPNTTPATPQSVTVGLAQGTGYTLGAQDSAGLMIGPPAAQDSSAPRGPSAPARGATLMALRRSPAPRDSTPQITIQSENDDVAQGMPATFVLSASSAPSTDLTINLGSGGTAGSDDVVAPPTSVVLAAGTLSTTVAVQTRVNTVVEQNPTIVMTVEDGTGYTVGSPYSAETTIENDNVPTLDIAGSTVVSPGGSATVTVSANQAPVQNTQVTLDIAGSAQAGTAYTPVPPVLTLDAGTTSASVTFHTLATSEIQPDQYIVVGITPAPGSYTVGSQGSAVITISQGASLPTVTLSSATTYLQKGEPYDVSVDLSQADSSALTVDVTYGGTAVAGTDYNSPGDTVVVPAGQTSAVLAIPTITTDSVESDRTLTVSLVAEPAYAVGSAGSVSVDITSSVVPVLTIAASTSAVSQGGAATFTVTANQAPVKDTSVNFTVEGTAVPGQAYVPLTGTALLLAGQTQVSVVLQSIQSDITFEPTDMIVGQWPIRIGQVFVKAGETVAPGEPVLSLVDSDLSVTLQASAANRSKLAVGQTCTVQIPGEDTSGTGTITELDSTATDIGSGANQSQVYEGTISVSDFSGADGSQVSINVVDQQVDDALTVPISAVKQNGVGTDVVRVIDLSKGGSVTEVPVTTGLTEGSYIQITKGLQLGELVISGTEQSS